MNPANATAYNADDIYLHYYDNESDGYKRFNSHDDYPRNCIVVSSDDRYPDDCYPDLYKLRLFADDHRSGWDRTTTIIEWSRTEHDTLVCEFANRTEHHVIVSRIYFNGELKWDKYYDHDYSSGESALRHFLIEK
ncbi:MAG: hypothetical protein LBJ23_06585 [Tannerella sp.]|nr:hypothetical protein [Tannerella sp.]